MNFFDFFHLFFTCLSVINTNEKLFIKWKKKFLYDGNIESGYYDKVFAKKTGIQSAWHNIKFNYFQRKIKTKKLHLDVGYEPGTFVNILNKKSIGIDVSKDQINYAKKRFKNKKFQFKAFKKNSFKIKYCWNY